MECSAFAAHSSLAIFSFGVLLPSSAMLWIDSLDRVSDRFLRGASLRLVSSHSGGGE